jgi:CHAD domain-containing protein
MTPSARSRATVVREIEHKFSVAALFQLPDLTVAGQFQVKSLEPVTQTAVYYDTVDLRLFRWGITLRRREGGNDAGWHLKLPVEITGGSRHVRDELQLPLVDHPGSSVPDEFAMLLPGFVREGALLPVVTLRTMRLTYLVQDPKGEAVAELVDDTVSVLNGRTVAARFREIEVEERGEPQAITDLINALRLAGAVPSSISKAATALGPASTAAADVPLPASVGLDEPAAAAVRSYLTGQVRAFLFADLNVRRDAPDSVHQLRVSVRRLRSALRTFAPLLAPGFGEHLRAELGWLASELGDSRDTEVMLLRLDDHAAVLPSEDMTLVRNLLSEVLPHRLAVARERAMSALESHRQLELVGDLVDQATSLEFAPPSERPSRDTLPPLADAAWAKLRRAGQRLTLDGKSDEWHRARILAKRARYTTEALTAIFGPPAQLRASALAQVTECLGEHQDAWLAQITLHELSRREQITGAEGFALGLLHEHERACEYAARHKFNEIWAQVRLTHREAKLDESWRA